MMSLSCKLFATLSMAGLILVPEYHLLAGVADRTGSEPSSKLWAHDNLLAWMANPPSDAKGRRPEERAQMLQALGFKNYAFRPEDQRVETYDAEIDALSRHGISLFAWRLDYEAGDAQTRVILDTIARHGIHPQLWVSQSFNRLHFPSVEKDLSAEEMQQVLIAVLREDMNTLTQEQRVSQEVDRIYAIAKLASQYGVNVELYNHNGWFGMPDNQVAIIERLRQRGVRNVGMVYNFVHARDELHDDTVNFPMIWKKIKPYVVAVNVTGMRLDQQFVYPSQGDSELNMMRTIQESGWAGPVGLIAEQGGDAEVTLKNYLVGLDWLAAELRQPGSGGGRPFPDIVQQKKIVNGPIVAKADDNRVLNYPWGYLTWYVSKELRNSDTMTVGRAVIKPGLSNSLHFHFNCDEVLHVLKGRILQTIGAKAVELGEGDTVSIPIGVKHGTKNIGTEDAVLELSYSSADRHVVAE